MLNSIWSSRYNSSRIRNFIDLYGSIEHYHLSTIFLKIVWIKFINFSTRANYLWTRYCCERFILYIFIFLQKLLIHIAFLDDIKIV